MLRFFSVYYLNGNGHAFAAFSTRAIDDDDAVSSVINLCRSETRCTEVEIWDGVRLVHRRAVRGAAAAN